MRIASVIIFFATSLACFFGGYQLGKSDSQQVEQPTASAPETTVTAPEEGTRKETEVAIEPALVAEETEDAFALRAKEPLQELSDRNGRQVVGQILEVQAESLKLLRQVDSRIVDIPISMLSDSDQAYSAYLLRKMKPVEPTPTTQSMEDKIWQELFN